MTKQHFLDRAKGLTKIIPTPEKHEEQRKQLAAARAEHLKDIAKFDPEAAKLEQAFFDANDAFADAELAVARHYASKLEK